MRTYRIDDNRTLRFLDEASAALARYRAGRGNEAGGILLGRVYPTEIVIETITQPNARDTARRFSFDRSRSMAQVVVDHAWCKTAGEQIYLGEWHSHPERVASPSGRDQTMILNMLHESRMEIDYLLLLVVGKERDWIGIARGNTVMQLH